MNENRLTTERHSDTTERHSDTTMMMYDAQKKSTGVAYLLWFFFGGIGAHRYYVGTTGAAVTMTLLFVLSLILTPVGIGIFGFIVLGLWVLIDAFLIPGAVSQRNMQLAQQLGAR